MLDTIFLKAFAHTKQSYPYDFISKIGAYIVDGKIGGVGFVDWRIKVKPNWFVIGAHFVAQEGYIFNKYLLLFNDTIKNQLNRCHSYYVDQMDINKGGGTQTDFSLDEILATLIDHAENFDESNCDSCKGIHPLQTHFIQLFEKFEE
jgi:hypothetical protein